MRDISDDIVLSHSSMHRRLFDSRLISDQENHPAPSSTNSSPVRCVLFIPGARVIVLIIIIIIS